jgi:hypothetical protein
MILGHYGVALAAKRIAKRTSLGTLIFAAQWADLLWPILLLTGFAGPPPADQRVIGYVTLILWLFVPWGFWVDRHRSAEPVTT